jgi:hypothetical protein
VLLREFLDSGLKILRVAKSLKNTLNGRIQIITALQRLHNLCSSACSFQISFSSEKWDDSRDALAQLPDCKHLDRPGFQAGNIGRSQQMRDNHIYLGFAEIFIGTSQSACLRAYRSFEGATVEMNKTSNTRHPISLLDRIKPSGGIFGQIKSRLINCMISAIHCCLSSLGSLYLCLVSAALRLLFSQVFGVSRQCFRSLKMFFRILGRCH